MKAEDIDVSILQNVTECNQSSSYITSMVPEWKTMSLIVYERKKTDVDIDDYVKKGKE